MASRSVDVLAPTRIAEIKTEGKREREKERERGECGEFAARIECAPLSVGKRREVGNNFAHSPESDFNLQLSGAYKVEGRVG